MKQSFTCPQCGNIYKLKNKYPFFDDQSNLCFFCNQEEEKEEDLIEMEPKKTIKVKFTKINIKPPLEF